MTMHCERTRLAMDAAFDTADGRLRGALPPAAAAHVASCASCRRAWEELSAIEGVLGRLCGGDGDEGIDAAPAHLHAAIMTRLDEPEVVEVGRGARLASASVYPGSGGVRGALAAAAVVVVVTVVVLSSLVPRTPAIDRAASRRAPAPVASASAEAPYRLASVPIPRLEIPADLLQPPRQLAAAGDSLLALADTFYATASSAVRVVAP